jgi:hypothetical protein
LFARLEKVVQGNIGSTGAHDEAPISYAKVARLDRLAKLAGPGGRVVALGCFAAPPRGPRGGSGEGTQPPR